MKSPGSPSAPRLRRGRRFALVALALVTAGTATVRAYDPPGIGPGLFSADGIFLAAEDRSSLLEALAAIGSNFPGNARVDDDLREKALALALRLDPLHHHSRAAYRDLAKGMMPPRTAFFDSLATVSETLWTIGNRLAEPPHDPEELSLAAYLLELSLLTHPEPPADRLETFATVCEKKAPEWEPALTLQRESNRSTDRAHSLFRESMERLREKRRETLVANRTAPGTPAPGVGAPSTSAGPAPDGASVPPSRMSDRPPIETMTVSIATVRQVVGTAPTPMAGTVSLIHRAPVNGIERNLVEDSATSGAFPLVPSDEEIPLNPLTLPLSTLPGRNWTAGAVGEVRFTPNAPPPGARRLLRTDAALPTLALIDSVLSRRPVNESFVLLGEINPATLQVELPGDLLATLEAAASLSRPYVLVPAGIGEPLVAYLQKSNQLELLFRTELITYSEVAEAVARLTSPTDPALTAASAVFAEIHAVSQRPDPAQRVALEDLAGIASAQEKLRGILAGVPAHLGARAMLEYGTRPVTPEILLSRYATQIDAVVEPFLAIDEIDGDFNGLKAAVEASDAQFLKLRAEIPLEARNLLGAAEKLVEAAERYLEMTNKTSSIGEQRLREARAAIAAFKSEKSRLGLESASSL